MALTAVLALLAAAALAGAAGDRPAVACAAAWLGAAAGTTLPDLDLILGLGHRSALTHGVLLALPLLGPRRRAAGAGLMLGLGLHLSADLFPNAMRGYATVKLPGAGSIGWGTSYLWLGANAAAAFALGGRALRRAASGRAAVAAPAGVAVLGAAYLLRTDGGWWALEVFALLAWAGLIFSPSPSGEG